MKKILLLISVIACFAASISAQDRVITTPTQFNFYGTPADTLDNAETKLYTIAVSPFATAVKIAAKVTTVTGTSSIKVLLQESYNNSYYKSIDSVTVTTAAPEAIGLKVTPYAPYMRLKLVGTGTHKSIPRIFIAIDNR